MMGTGILVSKAPDELSGSNIRFGLVLWMYWQSHSEDFIQLEGNSIPVVILVLLGFESQPAWKA